MRPLFHLYRRVDRLSHGLRQRLTPLGGWLLGGWIAAGVFGINTRVGMTYQLFALLSLLFVTALFASRFGKLPVTAERRLPRCATVGQLLRYRLRLRNHSVQTQHDLSVFDELYEPSNFSARWERFLTYRQWSQRTAWARGAYNAMQPVPTLPPGAATEAELTLTPWSQRTAWARGAHNTMQPISTLPPGAVTEMELTLTPLRRGWLEFAALRFGRPDPLGLWRRLFRQPLADRLLVLPRCYPVPPLHFHDGRRYQRGGVHLAQSVGEEDEFVGLRDYRPGDPPRRIHWRSFAKRGEPIVKEFQDEFFVRYGLLLDNCAIGVDDTRFEAAVSAAASIAIAERGPEALLDLLFVGDRAYCFTAGRGLGQTTQLLEVLACVTPRWDQPFSQLLSMITGHAAELSACVCVLLDWDAERQQLLDWLRGQGVETVVLVIGPLSAPPVSGVRVATAETLATELSRLGL
ncbi:MAG: DUF58 domain-containing protein [Gammaproteobacteria bacterium]|nr:DUF58 domain-containing protein [Gammaproteobacteria bacterium]MCP5196571.1 DUF58 domain-containing protein [Gammaproteobacteria bacterium]